MLESLLLTLSLSANVVCLPYDHRAIDVAEECYFSTTTAESNMDHTFSDRDLADKICVYTDRTVYAFCQNLVTSMLGSDAAATKANVGRAVRLALGRVQSGSSYVNDDLARANYVLLLGHTNDAHRDRVADLFTDYICGEAGIS